MVCTFVIGKPQKTGFLMSWPILFRLRIKKNELPHDKTNEMECVPSRQNQPAEHLSCLIRVPAVHLKILWDKASEVQLSKTFECKIS